MERTLELFVRDFKRIGGPLFLLLLGILFLSEYNGSLIVMEPILHHLRNNVDPGWTQVTSKPFHIYDLVWETEKNESCQVRRYPFPELVEPRTGFQAKFGIRNRLKPPTVHLQGTYEVHAGYYRSRNRTFNFSLVGVEQEVEVEYDMGFERLWRIRKVRISYKFQDVIFKYPDVGWFGKKLFELKGQCWHFHAPDLTRKKALSHTELMAKDIDFASMMSDAVAYRLFSTSEDCIS